MRLRKEICKADIWVTSILKTSNMIMTCLSSKCLKVANSRFITSEILDLEGCQCYRKLIWLIKNPRISTRAITPQNQMMMIRITEITLQCSLGSKRVQNKGCYLTRCRWPGSRQYSFRMKRKSKMKKMTMELNRSIGPLTPLRTTLMREESSIPRTNSTPTHPHIPNLDML